MSDSTPGKPRTNQDVFDTLTPEQKDEVFVLLGTIKQHGETPDLKHIPVDNLTAEQEKVVQFMLMEALYNHG